MSYPKILTIQDISCVGQCSLTVALPILSACGIETAILPSAVLSTHTAGFSGYTFRDLTEDMPKIAEHWKKENIKFDAIYTGYLGSEKQIDYVLKISELTKKENAPLIVDPAFADGGKCYPGFDEAFVQSMKKLCASADFIIPNITEAAFLTDSQYKSVYDKEYIDDIINKLLNLGTKTVVLTGVSFKENTTGVVVATENGYSYYPHEQLPNSCHGTGDIYASVFTGALIRGNSAENSAQIAADFVMECIKETAKEDNHWYGAKFETLLHTLYKNL